MEPEALCAAPGLRQTGVSLMPSGMIAPIAPTNGPAASRKWM